MFKIPGEYKIIDADAIVYIERRNRRNFLVTDSGEMQITGYTMHEIEDMLQDYDFFMCHQSFIISLSRVRGINEISRQLYEAHLEGSENAVPVSRNKYEELILRLKEFGYTRL